MIHEPVLVTMQLRNESCPTCEIHIPKGTRCIKKTHDFNPTRYWHVGCGQFLFTSTEESKSTQNSSEIQNISEQSQSNSNKSEKTISSEKTGTTKKTGNTNKFSNLFKLAKNTTTQNTREESEEILGTEWPGAAEIMNALENLNDSINDSIMSKFEIEKNFIGDPLSFPGNFATVYQGKYNDKKFALKIFTQKKDGEMERYRKLSEYFVSNKIFEKCTYFTDFEYLSDIITINLTGSKSRKKGLFPIIKMNWVEGMILEDFIKKTTEPKIIKKISDNFLKLINDLEDLNIAHGDLHPKNILVDDELNLKLVDYDCIYISDFKGSSQPELGDPDCQHPNRVNFPYDQKIDRFSSLVIYLALIAISENIELKSHKKSGEFIFSKSDFLDTTKSELFLKFKQLGSRVNLLSDELEKYCNTKKPKLNDLRTILGLEKDIV